MRFALVVLGTCLAVSSFAHADEWSKTYTIMERPDLRVETSDANIHVETWDQNTIEARVTTEGYKIGEGGIKIEEHQAGNSVEIGVRFPHDASFALFSRNRRVEIGIHMPREGSLNLHTGDGSIRLANFKGQMNLQTGDGSQDIAGVDGALQARTGDGHITAAGRFDVLDLGTGDGHIGAQALAGSKIAAGWNLQSGDGSVTLQLPASFAADVDFHTGDGHITLDIPISVEGRLGGNEIHGKINGGGALLTIHTGDGSIRLEKS